MRSKRVLLVVVFVLAAALTAAAEVALDEVVQAGRFVLYRDHADAHKYYYVPDAPRLALKRDWIAPKTFTLMFPIGVLVIGPGLIGFLHLISYLAGRF